MFGFSLLETVELPGAPRATAGEEDRASGRYERCAPEQLKFSDHIVTNLFLYHPQRHSDHHANPTRRYPKLHRRLRAAPNLPSGCASMVGLDLLRRCGGKVMDHRLLAHYDATMSPR